MLEPGSTISHYKILRQLGSGGMGEVYLARDCTLEREVAIKILPSELANDPDRLRRFVQEAKAASAVKHVNVALIHELGEANGLHFIVMEYVEGTTLEASIREALLETSPMIDLAIQIADALEEAHTKQVVHRDLKPSNIAITPRGHVKILDFGLAKIVREAADFGSDITTMAKTESGTVLGTIPYMSPEQALGKDIDHRTDIFSMGVILYQMSTGRLPFTGGPAEILDGIAHKEPEAIARFNYKIPAELDRIVRKCLEKDAGRRYQSARELWIDLTNLNRDLQLPKNARTKSTKRNIDSLAVLPFISMSPDPELEYLSDGITESLINSLSQLPKLRVVSRTTVFCYKGKAGDPRKTAAELNVQAVLAGRVLQRENNLSIRVELIDTTKDAQIWGEQYNRKLSDIFVLQEEIASQIASQLKLKLTREEKKKLTKRPTENQEAYNLYLKGRYFWNKRTRENMDKGFQLFQEALARDSQYTLAYGGIADYYIALVSDGEIAPSYSIPKAKEALMRALEIDNSRAEFHTSLAYIHLLYDWDWEASEKKFNRAMELNPAYVEAHHWYSHLLIVLRRFDESLAASLRALELEPFNATLHSHLGLHYWCARQYDLAIQTLNGAIELEPENAVPHFFLGRCYDQKHQLEEAISEHEKSVVLSRVPQNLGGLGLIYARAQKREKALEILKELETRSEKSYVSPCYLALIYFELHDTEKAFKWLERGYENRDAELVYLKIDPQFDGFRTDPHFADLQRRIGLP